MFNENVATDEMGPTRRKAWAMVAAATIGTACCSTSMVLMSLGLFMKPLSEEFGWARGDIAFALSAAALSMAAVNPFVGRAIDRFGVKPVLLMSLSTYALAAMSIPFLAGTGNIWGLHIGYSLVAALGAGSNVIAYVRLLSGWFSGPLENSRGLALGIAMSGVPLGGAVAGPTIIFLMDMFGWRAGFWGVSAYPLLIGLPLALFVIKRSPFEGVRVGSFARGQRITDETPGLSARQAMKTAPFWIMAAVIFLMSSCLQGMGIHLPALKMDLGISTEMLALVGAVGSFLGVGGRILAGYLFDRIFAPYVSMVIFALPAMAAFAVAGYPTLSVAILASLVIAFGGGAESDFIGYTVGRYFGLRSYGQIFGILYGIFMVGISVGPYLVGVGYDWTGSYEMPFVIGGVGLLLLVLLLVFLPRFPTEQEIGEGIYAGGTKSGHLDVAPRADAA